jgi:hypothetical protein
LGKDKDKSEKSKDDSSKEDKSKKDKGKKDKSEKSTDDESIQEGIHLVVFKIFSNYTGKSTKSDSKKSLSEPSFGERKGIF